MFVILRTILFDKNMKRAFSLNTNKDEYLICEFHRANKKQIIFK